MFLQSQEKSSGLVKNSKKIVIDARMMGVDNAGIGRSIEELVLGLVVLSKKQTTSLSQVADAPWSRGGTCYYLFLNKNNFNLIKDLPENWHKVLVDVRWYSLKEQWSVLLKLWQIKPDLVYFPHFNVPLFYFGKYIVTIHDLIWLKYPRPRKEVSTLGPFLYGVKNLLSKVVFYGAVKKASKIIVPTNFTKKDLLEFFKVTPEKIQVINWGTKQSGEDFDSGSSAKKNYSSKIGKTDEKNLYNFLKKCYNITKPYLLYVGSAYPHKNLDLLLQSFKNVDLDIQLVLVGGESYFYRKIRKIVGDLGLENRVLFTGFVEDKNLINLYKNGTAFVFPSLVEGFGFPPLEAMLLGVPVVCSNSSCLPEILGDAVLYFDPLDKKDLTQNINNIIQDKALRESQIKKGYKKVEEYDWKKCAREYQEVLKNEI